MIILSKQAGGTGVRLGIFLWLIEAAKVDQIFTRLAVTPDRLCLMDELFTCLLPVGQTKKKLPFFKITHEKNGQSNSSFHFFKQCKLRGTLFDFFFFSSPFVTSTGNDLGNGIEIAADRRFYFGLHSETEGGGLLFRFVVNINIFTSHPATRGGGGDEIKFPREGKRKKNTTNEIRRLVVCIFGRLLDSHQIELFLVPIYTSLRRRCQILDSIRSKVRCWWQEFSWKKADVLEFKWSAQRTHESSVYLLWVVLS